MLTPQHSSGCQLPQKVRFSPCEESLLSYEIITMNKESDRIILLILLNSFSFKKSNTRFQFYKNFIRIKPRKMPTVLIKRNPINISFQFHTRRERCIRDIWIRSTSPCHDAMSGRINWATDASLSEQRSNTIL